MLSRRETAVESTKVTDFVLMNGFEGVWIIRTGHVTFAQPTEAQQNTQNACCQNTAGISRKTLSTNMLAASPKNHPL